MKRVENSGEEPAVKQENLGEKLRKEALVVGKRGGHTTPVLPSWRLLQFSSNVAAGDSSYNYSLVKNFPPVSARKLAATLWELEHYSFSGSKMHQGLGGSNSRLRRNRQYQQHDPSPSSPDQPESAGSLRRHVAASLMQHHRSVQRNSRAIQPIVPASYESSMEVTPYNPAVTPTSSVDLNGGIGETSYSLKTSTELLKVLNRIWSLEEQHASNIALVRALKKELDHARGKIKELVRDQQADRHEMDVLMKQIADEKLDRKSKEHDRVNAAIQSVRDELEDERKLRRRSESLHRKLAKDLYEVKSSLSNALKDLERERKSRKLLEDLCDEFALGIRDYEQEVHGLKQKTEKKWVDRADRDRSILHISESWLDERIQMKQESQIGIGEKKSIVDKFTAEIEAYLQSKHNSNRKMNQDVAPNDRNLRRSSLESIPLNVAVSAPQDDGDDDDSAGEV
ncbi:Plasma membrane-like protein [Heracleum sosnowskyi]|uniref:Plasma membrane-like protein n=1 Tax=Heracleum sosnowskyi TaxID=360622 RepID=A0AAD8I3A7_9APIA|nr:Plasma membrane-like protein [Heracleum sosnowskyi]